MIRRIKCNRRTRRCRVRGIINPEKRNCTMHTSCFEETVLYVSPSIAFYCPMILFPQQFLSILPFICFKVRAKRKKKEKEETVQEETLQRGKKIQSRWNKKTHYLNNLSSASAVLSFAKSYKIGKYSSPAVLR